MENDIYYVSFQTIKVNMSTSIKKLENRYDISNIYLKVIKKYNITLKILYFFFFI